MAAKDSMEKELEIFRQSWKREVLTKKEEKTVEKRVEAESKTTGSCTESERVREDGTLLSKRPHDTDTLCANPYFQKDNQESCSEKKHEVLLSHKDVNEFRSRPNTFEPFLLAERLLEESSPSTSSRLGLRKRHGDDDLTEYLTTGSVLGKKKNVGSHEKQSEKKEARFLDLFLADIVSTVVYYLSDNWVFVAINRAIVDNLVFSDGRNNRAYYA